MVKLHLWNKKTILLTLVMHTYLHSPFFTPYRDNLKNRNILIDDNVFFSL